jgi:peptidyl-prolyl cis-trans isomerase B (cyclophilin B)
MNVFPDPPLLLLNAIACVGMALEVEARARVNDDSSRSGHPTAPRDGPMRVASDARATRLASMRRGGRGARARIVVARRARDDGSVVDENVGPSDAEDEARVRERAASRRVALGVVVGAVTTTATWARDSARAMGGDAVTARAFLDVGACEGIVNAARALGDDGGALCSTPEPFGRIEIELYGDVAPDTVRNFVALCDGSSASSLRGTIFHKIDKGNGYVIAGKTGSPRLGQVTPLSREYDNTDVTRASAFSGRHFRPGTVSLALESAASDGEFGTTAQFLILTGPQPCPALDGKNIVFGRVVRGLDVVQRLSNEKTFQPSETARAYNALANLVGDSRASKAKSAWIKPTRALVITDCGSIPV